MEDKTSGQPPSLDQLFKGILNNPAMQELVREAEEEQKRKEEREANQGFMELGRQSYKFKKDRTFIMSDEARRQYEELQELFPHLPELRTTGSQGEDLTLEPAPYLEYAVAVFGPNIVNNPACRYFLYGFANEALENWDVPAALVGFDEGGWLDDKFEGQKLQKEIRDKVRGLDAKGQVTAAFVWDRIQKARATTQPNPPVPPSSAPGP